MPHTKCETIYYFDELSDKAKERAREWYREGGLDYEWWDFTNVIDAAKYMGIEIDTKTQTRIGGYTQGDNGGTWDANKKITYQETCIYFSGFNSQGDGACFLGTWRASDMKPLKELKADFATDTQLHKIHTALWAFKKQYPEAICTSTRSSCHYSHERSTNLEAILGEEIDYNKETHKPLEECLVDFMKWIYHGLEKEYDYLNSDENVDDTIRTNEYEFTQEGRRA